MHNCPLFPGGGTSVKILPEMVVLGGYRDRTTERVCRESVSLNDLSTNGWKVWLVTNFTFTKSSVLYTFWLYLTWFPQCHNVSIERTWRCNGFPLKGLITSFLFFDHSAHVQLYIGDFFQACSEHELTALCSMICFACNCWIYSDCFDENLWPVVKYADYQNYL